jgi:decaprenylphospho-beta-D-ribofuranose 2-oxidase
MIATRRSRFVTFDGFVSVSTWHQRPDRYRHLEEDLGAAPRIPRGGGYSYAAASFGDGVIAQDMAAFGRLLDFDGNSLVRAEAGVTVERLSAWAAQRRLQLPVMPGYPLITIGGCIAADVHGKNPARDGTFADWVEGMTLYHPARGFHAITRTTHPDLFAATCGGFGLTGTIVSATLRLAPAPAANIRIESSPVRSLEEAIKLFSSAAASDLLYGWHAGDIRNASFGRGIVFHGQWTHDAPDRGSASYRPMNASQRAFWPWSLWNRVTIPLGQRLFAARSLHPPRRTQTPFAAAFPFASHTAYHRFFGAPGLAELQVLVQSEAVGQFIAGAAELVRQIRPPLVMVSTKPFSGRQRSLSVSGTGILFTFDLARTERTRDFLTAFDGLTATVRAQPNIAKDSRLPAAVVAATLPGYERFAKSIRGFDPDRLYQSELSRRIGL